MTMIRKRLKEFVAILGLFLVAGATSLYILDQQRMRFPLIEESPFVLKAEFSTAQAVVAGQGQTVRVSGVRIGDIGSVELEDGRAIVTMEIDREYEDMVRTDATALLRPKTGLKDMFIDLEPGTRDAPVAEEGWTIPVQATLPDVNPDEVFSTLDSATRDYLKLLISDAGRGLEGNAPALREVFKRFEPTHKDLARVNGAIAERRQNLRRLISSLNQLNAELARKDDDLAGLVDSSASVLRAFASEEGNVSAAVSELPSALQATTDALGRVETFAELLGPTTEKLRPAARALEPANDALRPFAAATAPLLREDIRPLVREARPLVRDLAPASRQLSAAAPSLRRVFTRLNHLFNLAAYNPNGREGPENAARQEGHLFWLAWLQHMAPQLFSNSDAHGTLRPVTIAAPCATVEQLVREEPELEFLMMLTPIFTESEACASK
jgi:phospholipid/cholesterol/gamma-HCH transport system substrate-binding protein